MKNSDEFFLELKDSVSIMDLYTEEPCDAHFHFHEDYEIYLFQGGMWTCISSNPSITC